MDDLFIHTLRDIYYAELQILEVLPLIMKKSSNPTLTSAFQHHMAETQNHVRRVEQVFEMHSVERKTVRCQAIDGIIKEAKEVVGDVESGDKEVRDAALIAAAQAVEHYEMTCYGTLISWARVLGRHDCGRVLEENLEEEKSADQKLTEIAESEVNARAA